jgi:hypothetical protein
MTKILHFDNCVNSSSSHKIIGFLLTKTNPDHLWRKLAPQPESISEAETSSASV